MSQFSAQMDAKDIIALLQLERHPEGGWYRETWRGESWRGESSQAENSQAESSTARSTSDEGGRSVGTAIYFLLTVDDFSHWHRVDATEIWHFYAGAPLVLSLSPNGHDAEAHHLGPELGAGQRPQRIVPAGWWQSATSLGAWTLVGCTVAPGFEFSGFELAAPDWRPTPR